MSARPFDPACAFLLELQFENLFEPASTISGENGPFRCKGCGDEVARWERQRHFKTHRRHRSTYRARHRVQVEKTQQTITASLDLGDRASAGAPEGARQPTGGRKRSGRDAPRKESSMAASGSTRKKTTGQRPSRARSAVAAPAKREQAAGEGDAIRSELLERLKDELGPFELKLNKAKTYERVFPADLDGKSIGYVFLARPSGIQIRIPERFLHLEPKMPNLEFAVTAYGFWYTLKSKRDVAKAAKAFKVAADDVRAAQAVEA